MDRFQYTLTPSLVRSVVFAHRCAGSISAMCLSHDGPKRLEAEATHVHAEPWPHPHAIASMMPFGVGLGRIAFVVFTRSAW